MQTIAITIEPRRLKMLRIGMGMTQQDLADAAGISVDTVVRWENGRSGSPHASRLNKIARALEVKPSELIREA